MKQDLWKTSPVSSKKLYTVDNRQHHQLRALVPFIHSE